MTTWTLVIYIYAGILAKGDSVSIAPIHGFSSEAECIEAGKRSEPLVKGSAKELRYVCLRQERKG